MLLTFGEGITYLCLVLMVLDLTPTAILLWQLPKPQSYVPTPVDCAHHFAQHHVEWQRKFGKQRTGNHEFCEQFLRFPFGIHKGRVRASTRIATEL